MAEPQTEKATSAGLRALVTRLSRWPAYLACGILVLLMLLTTVDVTLRYLFNAPIYGGLEISQSAMVALIMLAMAYTGATDAHVRVDVLDGVLGRLGRRLGEIFTGIISMVVMWFLVRRSYDKALDAREFDDVTNFLEMPIWPLYGLIVLGMGAFGLVIAVQVVLAIVGDGDDRN